MTLLNVMLTVRMMSCDPNPLTVGEVEIFRQDHRNANYKFELENSPSADLCVTRTLARQKVTPPLTRTHDADRAAGDCCFEGARNCYLSSTSSTKPVV